ncbi:MAG: AAA family ATPase [Methanomassiliicoccaceae archaeon]|nr:AAA family ATPase [Methanomassiliicoccaceae archaeon]
MIEFIDDTKFKGREWELSELNDAYQSDSFEMPIIYGRRRVGKTSLIEEFCKDKRTIFFPAERTNIHDNLKILTDAVNAAFRNDTPIHPFERFSDALNFIASKGEHFVFVIDEYPYLAKADPSVSSALQNAIDHNLRHKNIMIILCGSSMSFMEEQVLGYESPLFGRRTQQYHILPFDYYESGKWFSGYSNEDKALMYSVTGGIPAYLAKMDPSMNAEKNIERTFFKKNSYLFEEPSNLIKQELREPAVYNSILAAIADGNSKLNEISNRVKDTSGKCSMYLNRLISLGIVSKETPINEKESTKRTVYRIKDGMFRFWFRYVRENLTEIHIRRSEGLYEEAVRPTISQFMGITFEDMCKEYILRNSERIRFRIGEIGKWWGPDPATRTQEEIDLIALSPKGDRWMFCECKYRSEKVGTDRLEDLIRRSELVTDADDKTFCLFSKGGFTDNLIGNEQNNVRLIGLDDMYV